VRRRLRRKREESQKKTGNKEKLEELKEKNARVSYG
jgi:hypothetical protein